MARFYPPELLELIQSHNDIVEVVSQYFPLKRSGQNYKILCPFHSEKTPSFFVNPQKQIFHCFGCGAGGDVFSFIMLQENMTFPEAVRFLAERAHVELPAQDSEALSRKDTLFKVHELALSYYQWGLTKSKSGEKARSFLKARRISPVTITRFKLGYAQPGWDNFFRQARQKGFKAELLVEAGLALPRSGGDGYYDRFRDRLIIPVCDTRGRVIAFGGRVLDNSEPKYINSPDTPLFHKGQMLFGLHLAKEPISQAGEVILGEGYFDVIRAHQEKVENMVCSQGTAFTEIQAKILKRYTDKVVIAFDADQAGTTAALRGLAIFLHKNFEVRIALLPPGDDPDSFIREKGPEAFRKTVGESIPLLDFKLQKLCEKHDLRTDRGKLALSREMLETISQIESAVLRDSYTKKLARRLGVSQASVWEDYRQSTRKRVVQTPSLTPPEKGDKFEVRLLKFILENDKIIRLIGDELDPSDFTLPLRPIAQAMLKLYQQGKTPLSQSLTFALSQEAPKALVSRWLIEPLSSQPSLLEVSDVLIDLRTRGQKAKIQALNEEVARSNREGKEIAPLQRECLKLRRELDQIPARIRKKIGI